MNTLEYFGVRLAGERELQQSWFSKQPLLYGSVATAAEAFGLHEPENAKKYEIVRVLLVIDDRADLSRF